MAGFRHLALLALGWTASAEPVKRQTTSKYCPGGTTICFSEYKVEAQNLIYRIAIPDVSAAPFDILLQIVAPKTIGWAGIAWGGQMSNNPLTIGWPNGNSAVVSSRWTSGKSLPGAYAGARYTTLPTSTSNSTHWQLDVLCQGCSQWANGALNPNGQNALAWAKANRAVSSPSSNTSSFAAHDAKAIFAHDLSQAKVPKGVFDAIAYDLENNSGGGGNTPASSVQTAVQTAVVTLPKPSSAAANPVPTRLTALPDPEPVASTVLGPLNPIPTRLTALPDPDVPLTSASRTRAVITTVVTQLPPVSKPSRPVTTVVTVVQPQPTPWTPPNQGGGGGGWGKGKWGGGGGGGGRGGGRGRRPGEDGEE
ncbi:hypothetical protein V8F20_012810 [Naviculisporaceae sp. PSN 640]